MHIALRDVPGMLVRALEPISSKGGNILSVVHSRGKGSVVGVHIIFRVKDEKTLGKIIAALKKGKYEVEDVQVEGKKYFSKKTISFLIVGHVIDKDIQDTIDRINELGLVRDVDVRMRDPEEESAVLMRVNVDSKKKGKLMERITQICENKRFMLIREVS